MIAGTAGGIAIAPDSAASNMHPNADIAQPIHALERFVKGARASLCVVVAAIKMIKRDSQRKLARVGGIKIQKPLFDPLAHHRQHGIG